MLTLCGFALDGVLAGSRVVMDYLEVRHPQPAEPALVLVRQRLFARACVRGDDVF
jgi:hypothetical protein